MVLFNFASFQYDRCFFHSLSFVNNICCFFGKNRAPVLSVSANFHIRFQATKLPRLVNELLDVPLRCLECCHIKSAPPSHIHNLSIIVLY